jgi:hypothetical protein
MIYDAFYVFLCFYLLCFLTVMLWKHGLTKTYSDSGRFGCGTYCFMYGCALAAPSQIIEEPSNRIVLNYQLPSSVS